MNDTLLLGLLQPEVIILIGCLIWAALTVMAWVFILKAGSRSASEYDKGRGGDRSEVPKGYR